MIASASSSWPTPDASLASDGEGPETFEARRQRNLDKGINGNGQRTPMARDNKSGQASEETTDKNSRPLNEAAERWPTPVAADCGEKQTPNSRDGKTLLGAADQWRTPRSAEAGHYQIERDGAKTPTLDGQASNWATPTTSEQKGAGHSNENGKNLRTQVSEFSPQGPPPQSGPESSPKPPTSRRRLNGVFVSWLMGFPWYWMRAELTPSASVETAVWRCKLRQHLCIFFPEMKKANNAAVAPGPATLHDLTKAETLDVVDRVRTNCAGMVDDLTLIRDRRGYLSLGYDSFAAFAQQELEMSRSNVYRLLAVAEVQANTGVTLPAAHAEIVAAVVPDQQAGVVAAAAATAAAAGTAVTAEDVADAAADATKKAAATPPKITDTMRRAQARVADICGPEALDYANGEKFSCTEMAYWAGLEESDMKRVHAVVIARQLRPTKAYAFLQEMPGVNTPVSDMVLMANLNGLEFLVVDTGEYTTVCFKRKDYPNFATAVTRTNPCK